MSLVFAFGLIGVLAVLLPLLAGGVFVIVVVANRADPDPTGRRPATVYAFGTAFVTLFVTLFATAAFVAALCQLIGDHPDIGGGDQGFYSYSSGSPFNGGPAHPVGDAVARAAVLTALIALVAGAAFALHARAASRATAGAATGDPVARVRASYVSAVSFVCVLIAIVSVVFTAYDVFRLAGPGVFAPGGGGRANVLRSLLPLAYLAVASLVILAFHLRHAPPPIRPRLLNRWWPSYPGGSGAGDSATATVGTEEPEMPSPELLEGAPTRTARKRAPAKTVAAKTTPAKRAAAKRTARPPE